MTRKTCNDMMIILLLLVPTGIKAVEMNYERGSMAAAVPISSSGGISTSSLLGSSSSARCPRGCSCTASDVLDCVERNFTQPPIPIEDSKASDLLLASNKIAQIDLVFLKHYPSLKLLSLSNNGLRYKKGFVP